VSELIITRKVRFNSAHRLHSKHLSAEQNKAVYGKCNNANGHGHEYVLTVALKGEADPVTGMVFDLSELSHILQETIHAQFDHKHLDRDLPYFQDLVSTAENIAMVLAVAKQNRHIALFILCGLARNRE